MRRADWELGNPERSERKQGRPHIDEVPREQVEAKSAMAQRQRSTEGKTTPAHTGPGQRPGGGAALEVPGGRASLVLEAVFDAPLAASPKRRRIIWKSKLQGEGEGARDSTRGAIGGPASPA